MIKNFKYYLLFSGLISFFFTPFSFAQDGQSIVTRDLESWSKISLGYNFNKKWNINLDQGFRLKENSSVSDQLFTNLGIAWKPIKVLKFGIDFRYIYDRGNNLQFDNDFRINIDANYKKKIDRFSMAYRIRYQNRNEIGFTSEDGDIDKNYLRFRTKLKYNIKNWKFDPDFSVEIFRDLTKHKGGFDLVRFTLGTSYKFKKFGELGTYYRVEREIGLSYPKTTHIIGINYKINLKSK